MESLVDQGILAPVRALRSHLAESALVLLSRCTLIKADLHARGARHQSRYLSARRSDDRGSTVRERERCSHELDRSASDPPDLAQVDEGDAVLSGVDHLSESDHQSELLGWSQITQEHRVLKSIAMAPDHIVHLPQPTVVTNVVSHEPPASSRHRVTTGWYCAVSPSK